MRRIVALLGSVLILFTSRTGYSEKVMNSESATFELRPFDSKNANAADVLRHVYTHVSRFIRPGVTTEDVEMLVARLIDQTKAEGYFKGYRGYPAYIGASINNEVLHAVPSNRRLVDGDLLKLEIGVRYSGQYAFVAWTFPIGKLSDSDARLIRAAQDALSKGIQKISDGVLVSELSKTMDGVIRSAGYTPNADFVGYQMGERPVMSPQIPCSFSAKDSSEQLSAGMRCAIIVIVHEGSPQCLITSNGWNVISKDGKRSVIFSRLVEVTAKGSTVLTDFPDSEGNKDLRH